MALSLRLDMHVDPAELQKQLAIGQHSRQAEEFADRYRELDSSIYRSCFAYSRWRLDALLDRYLPKRGEGRRLLDVGCGTGHHMASLCKRGFEVAGVDGSEEMIAHARTNNPEAQIECSDVDQLPFADGSFDFVLCVEVLRYLPDSTRCVNEIARVLKPGGVCLVTATPLLNLNGYWLVNRMAGLFRLGGFVHLKQFFTTSWRLRRSFAAAGFVNPTLHGVYLGPINWVERLAPSLLPRTLKAWEAVDSANADRKVIREFSNMFLVHGVRGS
ncbi:MAG TPA: class I SAM-dependent methyltransferase [Blastocatellia bacterium]|nr:class I SAM-dependent methyltransferase [Blastocatellia bacterium]